MAEPMYFQWQNEFLLKTIYPMRNRKLADFLIYCQEIDLWKEYEGREPTEQEKKAYREERDQAVMIAYKVYKTEYDYFQKGDVKTAYMGNPKVTEADLAPIKELHGVFQKNLTDRQTVRREKVLIAYYVTVWQQRIRNLADEVKRLERRLTLMHPEHRDRALVNEQLKRLNEVILPMMNLELERLLKFLSTFNQVEKRKLEFHKKKEAAERENKSTLAQFDAVRAPLSGLEAKVTRLSAELARLKSPPKREAFEGYFLTGEVAEELGREFPQATPDLIDVISSFHKRLAAELRALADDNVKRVRLKNYIDELRSQFNRLLSEVNTLEAQLGSRSMKATTQGDKHARLEMLKGAGLKAVETELEKLSNYHAAIEYGEKTESDRAKPIQSIERELKGVTDQLSKRKAEAALLEEKLKGQESILKTEESSYLVSFDEQQPVTPADIVRGKVEKYKASLEQKIKELGTEGAQQYLLEQIVQRFRENPGEYPLWLQYMVIHFSGMRYATAHGSWADPKDLLISLRTSDLDREFSRMDAHALEGMVETWLSMYEAPDPATAPKLALEKDEEWTKKRDAHLEKLRRPYDRRDSLLGLRLEEERHEIESMSPADALAELEAMKDEKSFPKWMWDEIVRLTDLRIKEVKSQEWEKLTKEQQDEKNEARYAEYRAIMNKWKMDHLTGWREEHAESNRLIVTRSVCNEVAEQIQHLRGHTPSGGLTGIVDWYMKIVKGGKVPGDTAPYFMFVRKGVEPQIREGANILWLRFVHEKPNPWRVAKPLEVNGDRLIPENYRSKEGKPDEWTYFEGGEITRRRSRTVGKRVMKDEQWLRWMHAATVAKVADTADGTIVLTFETALPYDDPGVSSVGIFKHDLNNLLWDGGEENYNGSFLAYLPEGEIPSKDLEEMLDWNKILRRQVLTPTQLADYRKKYIRKQ